MLDREMTYPLRQCDFENALQVARQRMPNLVRSIISWTQAALELRRQILSIKRPYPGMRDDLEQLLPSNFLTVTPFEQLSHLPRFLKTIVLRADRADRDQQRDHQRAQQLAPYLALVRTSSTSTRAAPSKTQQVPPSFRWMVEEFKVSLFAQELGTPYPISAKRLDAALKQG
jgi:ATP-dependent helicase HrpA